MGNEANCKKFCDHQEEEKPEMSQIKINEYPLDCLICHQQVEHTNFKLHLDIHHFASIQQKNQHISVICILCDHSSQNLQDHHTHMNLKHSYVNNNLATPGNQTQSNSLTLYHPSQKPQTPHYSNKRIKQLLTQIDNVSRLRITQQIDVSTWTVEHQSKQYKMYKSSKQYDGMEYDEKQVFIELVLTPACTLYKPNVKFYIIEKVPLQKTILCNAYLLCEKN